MAFTRLENITIDTIKDIEILLFVPEIITIDNPQVGKLSVQVELSNGEIDVRKIDLLARLQDDAAGQSHLANLVSLRDYIKARLEAELLPL